MHKLYEDKNFAEICGDTCRVGALELTKYALNFCTLATKSKIVDLGCGNGTSLKYLASLGYDILGIDTQKPIYSFPFLQASIEDIPLVNDSFDLALSECVFSVLKNPNKAWSEVARIIKTNAYFIYTDLYQNRDIIEEQIAKNKMILLHFSDHNQELKELVAKLIWYGNKTTIQNLATYPKNYSYGLWVCQKRG